MNEFIGSKNDQNYHSKILTNHSTEIHSRSHQNIINSNNYGGNDDNSGNDDIDKIGGSSDGDDDNQRFKPMPMGRLNVKIHLRQQKKNQSLSIQLKTLQIMNSWQQFDSSYFINNFVNASDQSFCINDQFISSLFRPQILVQIKKIPTIKTIKTFYVDLPTINNKQNLIISIEKIVVISWRQICKLFNKHGTIDIHMSLVQTKQTKNKKLNGLSPKIFINQIGVAILKVQDIFTLRTEQLSNGISMKLPIEYHKTSDQITCFNTQSANNLLINDSMMNPLNNKLENPKDSKDNRLIHLKSILDSCCQFYIQMNILYDRMKGLLQIDSILLKIGSSSKFNDNLHISISLENAQTLASSIISIEFYQSNAIHSIKTFEAINGENIDKLLEFNVWQPLISENEFYDYKLQSVEKPQPQQQQRQSSYRFYVNQFEIQTCQFIVRLFFNSSSKHLLKCRKKVQYIGWVILSNNKWFSKYQSIWNQIISQQQPIPIFLPFQRL